ncbi:MAG: nucleoside deaminase, partial [Bacilli bacterium]|nr:nucleoside deaminase [Bacilli bacterium]
ADNNLVTNVGGPFGAVVVKDDKIIGRGSNHVLGHKDPTAHAEIEAIRDACKTIDSYDLTGCTIYTTCYPCPMCMSAIIWSNIKKVYYGNSKIDAANIGFRDDFIYQFIEEKSTNKEILELIELDKEYTIETFNQFQNKQDKTIY